MGQPCFKTSFTNKKWSGGALKRIAGGLLSPSTEQRKEGEKNVHESLRGASGDFSVQPTFLPPLLSGCEDIDTEATGHKYFIAPLTSRTIIILYAFCLLKEHREYFTEYRLSASSSLFHSRI